MYRLIGSTSIFIITYLKSIQFGLILIYPLNLKGDCKFIIGFVHLDTNRVDSIYTIIDVTITK